VTKLSDTKDRCLLEMCSDEQDIRILNTKLIDFVVYPAQAANDDSFQNLLVNILLLCRSQEKMAPRAVRAALATALFMIQSKDSAVCMLEQVEKFVKKLN